jgi:glycosyltransferase involved in cell wall biosynthesis
MQVGNQAMPVSVIIPVYQAQDSLSRCLDSFLNQDFSGSLEILCIGDKVEDESHAVVERYARNHPGLVSLHLQNGRGQGGARNLGLDLAQGEYVMFADADDYVEPAVVRLCMETALESGADFVCVGFDRRDASGRQYSREQTVETLTLIDVKPLGAPRLAFIYPAPWGKLFKRAVIDDRRFPEGPIPAYEDTVFFLSLCPKIRRFAVLPNILYHYVVHEESSITRASLEKTRIFRCSLAALGRDFLKHNLPAPYLTLLDLAAFIHVGVADAHRIAECAEVPLPAFCAGARTFLDQSFPGWRRIPLRPWGRFTLRCTAVWFFKLLHQARIFWLFIRMYNLMIKKLHIDVKW